MDRPHTYIYIRAANPHGFTVSLTDLALISRSHGLVSRSRTVTLAVTWTTAVKRFVPSSPGSRVGDKWL